MMSSLFDTRPRRKQSRADRSPFASSYGRTATPPRLSRLEHRGRTLRYEDEETESESVSNNTHESGDEATGEDSDGEQEASPLLPLFDSTKLDALHIYTLTHTIRLLVVSRCETVLSWEQLRSPQVSQFLLKPIQQEVRSNHFSAATLYCLMANCLQFTKEIALYPGNSGTSQTRAMICELIAIKLLREYSTRGLIDALSYDFDPLQGQNDVIAAPEVNHRSSWQATTRRPQSRSARISCLEIAIRAEAKRFLAHPLVVQQLEAIWNGSVVFHAAADSIHRLRPSLRQTYGAIDAPLIAQRSADEGKTHVSTRSRKVVTLYNPRDASLFKLSRLRVPRYRNILSTLSFAVLLGLFLAVLVRRSLEITPLEILFWFWAAGYMIDEVAGFTEQGFSLYLASFWNTFDLGILLVLFVHLCLRVYGIVMHEAGKHRVASMAYDLLAADAILLFPRLFSVLDHYRYFSQLIIAFRMMAADLAAVFVLIVISCSGFFVALSLSFGYDGTDNAADVAYALLQMLMGFTPAAWDRWENYTLLGRTILTLFLFICHFLVVTILITVLTNSFMAVVKNANEEHQFIFAINTISSVKSDALFSYVAPFNVLGWMLHPARYVMPFRQYVKLNRTVIKITHFPILFTIYLYEKTILQSGVVDSTDTVENRRGARSMIARRLPRLVRETSMGNYRQDQALEEVFKQPFDTTVRTDAALAQRKSSNVVSRWMNDMGEGDANPPQEDDPKTVHSLEHRRLGERSLSTFSRVRKSSQRAPSLASDPGDITSHVDFFSPQLRMTSAVITTPSQIDIYAQEETADGDDEMMTNEPEGDQDDQMTTDARSKSGFPRPPPASDYFTHRSSLASGLRMHSGSVRLNERLRGSGSRSGTASPSQIAGRNRPRTHVRNASSATMIFNPPASDDDNDDAPSPYDISHAGKASQLASALRPGTLTPSSKHASSGTNRKTPKQKSPPRTRPTMPSKSNAAFRSTPDLGGVLGVPVPENRRRASLEMDIVSDIGDNKAIGGGYIGAIPASFATQMAYATGGLKKIQQENKEEQQMFGRLMMARMNSLEEGFRDVIHEMRENLKSNAGSRNRSPERPVQARRERRAVMKTEARLKENVKPSSSSTSIGIGGAESTSATDPRQSGLSLATTLRPVEHQDQTETSTVEADQKKE